MNAKDTLVAVGFDAAWLGQMEEKHGAEVIGVISDFMNMGFTVAWVISSLDKLHPLMIDILYKVFTIPGLASVKLGATSDAVAGGAVVGGALDGIINKDTAIFLLQKAIELLPTLGLSGWKLYLAKAGLQLLLSVVQSQSSTPAV
jgi:hypothetical protein